MTDAAVTPDVAIPRVGRIVGAALLMGLSIQFFAEIEPNVSKVANALASLQIARFGVQPSLEVKVEST